MFPTFTKLFGSDALLSTSKWFRLSSAPVFHSKRTESVSFFPVKYCSSVAAYNRPAINNTQAILAIFSGFFIGNYSNIYLFVNKSKYFLSLKKYMILHILMPNIKIFILFFILFLRDFTRVSS